MRSLDSAYREINAAITAAITHRKPVYISIPCNLAAAMHPSFAQEAVPFTVPAAVSVPGVALSAARRQGRLLELPGQGAGGGSVSLLLSLGQALAQTCENPSLAG